MCCTACRITHLTEYQSITRYLLLICKNRECNTPSVWSTNNPELGPCTFVHIKTWPLLSYCLENKIRTNILLGQVESNFNAICSNQTRNWFELKCVIFNCKSFSVEMRGCVFLQCCVASIYRVMSTNNYKKLNIFYIFWVEYRFSYYTSYIGRWYKNKSMYFVILI